MVPLFSKEKRFFENKGASNRLAVRAEFLAASNFSFFHEKARFVVGGEFFFQSESGESRNTTMRFFSSRRRNATSNNRQSMPNRIN